MHRATWCCASRAAPSPARVTIAARATLARPEALCFPCSAMLDPRTLEERRDEIAESCRRRRLRVDVDAAIACQKRVSVLQQELQELNRQRNEHQTTGKQKLDSAAREAHTAEGRRLKDAIAGVEAQLFAANEELEACLAELPNFLHPDVPDGGEADFRELRRVGEPTRFDFEARDHLALCAHLDLVDFDAAARVSGPKFYYLKNEAVLLELALQRFALESARDAGYRLYSTPDLARRSIVDAMGFSPRGDETQIYSVAHTDLDLVGTAEITLGGLHADEVLDEAQLPLRCAGLSHCFRTEAGSHGRESKGLYRVHQFSKVELFVFSKPADSDLIHAELLALEERLFQALELPYRVIEVAAADLGAPAYRKFDLEAWMPGRGERGEYGEVTSTSNCTDYQARRLKTRYRPASGGKNELVHTLNGTAIAVTRALVALFENHQQRDGSIRIPRALVPYAGFDRIGPR